MKKFFLFLFIPLFLFASQFDRLADQFNGDTVPQYNPALTTSLSIIPGGGQLFTRHFTRGSLFLGMSLLMGTQSYMRHEWYTSAKEPVYVARNEYDSLRRTFSAQIKIETKDSTELMGSLNELKLREFEKERAKIEWLNWSGWFAGIYAWNLVDGYGCSNRFTGRENPTPKRAAWLSAIPFSGAGQLYNGSIFKGAMFSTVQLGCLYSAINFQRVMNLTEKYKDELVALPDGAYKLVSYGEQQQWDSRYETANRSRTMFMWYGVIFYLYGIADAAVDAHLDDFNRHFQITSSVDPVDGRVAFGVNGQFGKR